MKKTYLFLAMALTAMVSAFANNPVKVACVGNSITYGMTLDNPSVDSYPAQLQEMLGSGYVVGNFGKSGATLTRNGYRPYNEQEEYRRALDFAGDIVVIHLGINDTDPRVWPHLADEFVVDYLTLIDSLRSVNPDARFYIARLSPISDRHPRFKSGTRDWRDQIQSLVEEVALISGAELIDFEAPLQDMPWMLPDGLHPNKEGASRLAQTVYSAITGDYGGLSMPAIYGSGMVLPAGRELTVSGTADAGAKVSLSIGRQVLETVSGADGKWSLPLLPLKAGGPYTMQVTSGGRTLTFNDVMAGVVWLASGQSNMEFKLRDAATAEEDIAQADNPNLRLYNMDARWRTNPEAWPESALDSVNRLQYFSEAGWKKSTPSVSADFSAIAYHFGRMLADSLDVPVGIICNAVGGSTTESWVDRVSLEHEFPDILAGNGINDFVQPWVRERTKQNLDHSTNPLQRHPFQPAYLYESGIAPLLSYPIDGVIWYQGESNAHNIEAHEKLFEMLVRSWRSAWGDPELPFLFVQLSSLNRKSWPQFRYSQYEFANDRIGDNIFMVVSSDKGDYSDVHPKDKRPIGRRLGRLALRTQYGRYDIEAFSPYALYAVFSGDEVEVRFDDNIMANKLSTSDGESPSTFEVAEFEGLYYPASAMLGPDSTSVIVRSDSVHDIRYVRYGWQPYTTANLINRAGLPMSTFKISSDSPREVRPSVEISPLPDLKGNGGYAKGVSAAFAGRDGRRTVIAGGANFPGVPAADGGKKAYYDHVYYLPDGGKQWVRARGNLPYPVAYGASVSTPEGIICAGGLNSDGPIKDVFLLTLDDKGRVHTKRMPDLPVAIDNAGAAYTGDYLYIVGGNADGEPSNEIYSLNLSKDDSQWDTYIHYDNSFRPLTQPATASAYGTVVTAGGFAGRTSAHPDPTLQTDAKLFGGPYFMESISVPDNISLGGGTATSVGDGKIVFTGGVNAEIFLNALRDTPEGYLNHPAEWYRFNRRLLMLDVTDSTWSDLGEYKSLARAGAMAVPDGCGGVIVVGGELKPGIRTTSAVRISIKR